MAQENTTEPLHCDLQQSRTYRDEEILERTTKRSLKTEMLEFNLTGKQFDNKQKNLPPL